MKSIPQLSKLAYDLVCIPSESGSETKAMEHMESLARAMDFQTQRIEVDSNRWNLLITNASSQPIETLLTTHMDTVPGGPEPKLTPDTLWGRGSCDAKGIAACMFCALCDLRLMNVTNVALLLVVGEETRSDGAKAAARALKPVKRFINGEPTELKFVAGQKGVLKFALHAHGKCAHSGYPELGHSAVHTLLDTVQSIRNENWPNHPTVGKTLVNVGMIEGGIAANVTAPSANATIMMRLASSASEAENRVRELLPADVDIEIYSSSHPQILEVPEGEQSISVGYGSDVPHLRPLGVPLMYGPGSIHVAHTDHEHVLLKDLETARKKYTEICMKENIS